jgi:chaperonin GroES
MQIDDVLTLPQLLGSANIAELLDDQDLSTIGHEVIRLYDIDKESRLDWEKKMEDALKLATQVSEKKSFPWPNASNVKFPLITVAALQYHSRAYPALLSGNSLVLCRTVGEDPTGEKGKRADRIAKHMSYQILEEDEGWEDQMDKVLITQPIIGCAFKKSYFDSFKGHNVSENIFAKDLVVSYYTKTLEDAPRISHVMYLTNNEIRERVLSGLFCEPERSSPAAPQQNSLTLSKDKAQGVTQPYNDPDTPTEVIEQHCWIDFDGDGYQEPYIVIVQKETRQVLRIVARYFPSSVKQSDKGDVLKIVAENYFTKYPFIPSPDGGFYDLGFGALLGPLNESINTIVNQLIDAGTLNNTGGGFLGRGIKFRGGQTSFVPGEWKPVDSTGDDLRKGIVPLQTPQPSPVLFQMLELLINYGERVGGATDALVGQNPGQNTPAETSRSMVEQGSKVFNGIFKRTYRSLKDEFKKLYRLNQLYLDDETEFPEGLITANDYQGSNKDVRPAADPNMVSDSQRISQATALLQMASSSPGFNIYQVQKRVLDAWKVADVEQVLPDPKGPNALPPPGPGEKVQIEQMKMQTKMKDMEAKHQLAVVKLLQIAELDKAKILKMEAEAEKADAEAKGVPMGHAVGLAQIQLAEAKAKHEGILSSLKLLQSDIHHQDKMDATKDKKD